MTRSERFGRPILEPLLVLLAFIAILGLTAGTQAQITVNGGLGWDGTDYYALAQKFASGEALHGEAPQVYRLGTPFIAALISPHDIIRGFLLANLAASALIAALMTIWLRMHLTLWVVRCALIFLYLASWLGPIRKTFFYPVQADPWFMVFILAGLIAIESIRAKPSLGRLTVLSVICFLGCIVRESGALIGVAALFASNPLFCTGRPRIAWPGLGRAVPLACAVLGIAVSHLLVTTDDAEEFSFVIQAGMWLYRQALVMYVHAWLIAYGPILFLLIFGWREVGRLLWQRQYQLVYLAGVICLAWIGGADTERFALWAAPVTYVLCGTVIEAKLPAVRSWGLLTLLAASQLISARLFWTTPDEWGGTSPSFTLLTAIGDVSYHNLLSRYGGRSLGFSLLEYAAVGLVLVAWMTYRDARVLSPGGRSGGSGLQR